jgi:trehalose 6-phosphate synthase
MTNPDWNRDKLAAFAGDSFKSTKLIVVSCRAPYIHEHRDGRITCISPAGGLTTALKPTMAAVGGVWIAQASGSADRETASPRGRLRVPPERPTFELRRLWLSPELRRGHYEGLSNSTLWPLCHNVFRRPVFRQSDWDAYRQVNQIFAQAVLDEADDQPAVVFIQDYHFGLLPGLLKAANPALTIGQFWHIPFPHREKAQTFPWMDDLLKGMLGSDVLGFHLPRHCRNFVEAVEDNLEAYVERNGETIWLNGNRTCVRDVPISIDFDQHNAEAASAEVEQAMQSWQRRIGSGRHIGLGIDRMDYTKGIPERLRAVAALFESNPDLRGKFTFVQVGVPSRTNIDEYQQLAREIDAEVLAVNRKWATGDWTPVILEKRNLAPVEMMALHRLARFCAVTPLHDGMNLVAKEFVASRFDEDGVLILSRFAGAAEELRTALLVNPYSEVDLCRAMHTALNMKKPERQRRIAAARMVVERNNVYCWAGQLLQELRRHAWGQADWHRPGMHFGTVSASVA